MYLVKFVKTTKTISPLTLVCLINEQVRLFFWTRVLCQHKNPHWKPHIKYHFFYFSCPENYLGDYCQHENPCYAGGRKCQNGGTCRVLESHDRVPTFKCECPIGYTASFCEIEVWNLDIENWHTSCNFNSISPFTSIHFIKK